MTVLVKVCGMTDKAAVRAAIDAGADAVGFVFFERSPRNLRIDDAARLAALVPDGVKKVAVTMHPDVALWEAVRSALRPHALQTDSNDFATLDIDDAVEKWPVIREGSVPESLPELFVYEGRRSGKGETVDWRAAADYARRGRMILAGGLSAENVAEAINIVRPYAVDVSSAVESSPGRKDPEKIRAFVKAAKAA